LLILGERTGSRQRNNLNISLPSHCCPTPCIQASITLTLEAVTVAHQRGFWRRGRPVAILGVGHIKSVGRNRDIAGGGGVDPLVTAHDGTAAQHGADHLGGKVLGGATQEPGGGCRAASDGVICAAVLADAIVWT
jgi:hypothetical protein